MADIMVLQVGVDTMLEVSMQDVRTKSIQLTTLFLHLVKQVLTVHEWAQAPCGRGPLLADWAMTASQRPLRALGRLQHAHSRVQTSRINGTQSGLPV